MENNCLIELYKKLYEQRNVLTEAPPLTVPVDTLNRDFLDFTKIQQELNAIMSYLLSIPDITKLPLDEGLKIVRNVYSDQPFWKELLLEYYGLRLAEEKQKIKEKKRQLKNVFEEGLKTVTDFLDTKKRIISSFLQKMKKKNYPVDAKRLITNYWKMCGQDAEKAWNILTTNPAFFAPIITVDEKGKTVISPKKASAINNELANFLKKMTIEF